MLAHLTLYLNVLLQGTGLSDRGGIGSAAEGNSISSLIGSYKQAGAILIGIGLLFALAAVIKIIVTEPEKARRAITAYIIALIIYFALWALL